MIMPRDLKPGMEFKFYPNRDENYWTSKVVEILPEDRDGKVTVVHNNRAINYLHLEPNIDCEKQGMVVL